GNHVLVNGRKRPRLSARAGVPQRWRIVNAAKSKYFQLQLTDAPNGTVFTVIGGDGGLQEYAVTQETLVIAPGERVDAIVTANGAPGTEILVQSLPYNRGYGSEYLPIEGLFTIALIASPSDAAVPVPTVRRTIAPINPSGATAVDMELTLVQLDDRKIEYRINNVSPADMKPIQAAMGETQIWTITNKTK